MDIFEHFEEDTILESQKNMTTVQSQETTIATASIVTMGSDSRPILQCTSLDPTTWGTMDTLCTLSTNLWNQMTVSTTTS